MSDNDSASNNSQVTNQEERFFSLLSDKDRAAIWDRMLAKAARSQGSGGEAPSGLTEFDQDFFAQAEPKLAGYVRLGAYMVGKGLETFTLAHRRVMRAALKYGAEHLSEAAFCQLDSWVDRAILACIDEPAPEGVIPVERLREISGEGRR